MLPGDGPRWPEMAKMAQDGRIVAGSGRIATQKLPETLWTDRLRGEEMGRKWGGNGEQVVRLWSDSWSDDGPIWSEKSDT